MSSLAIAVNSLVSHGTNADSSDVTVGCEFRVIDQFVSALFLEKLARTWCSGAAAFGGINCGASKMFLKISTTLSFRMMFYSSLCKFVKQIDGFEPNKVGH